VSLSVSEALDVGGLAEALTTLAAATRRFELVLSSLGALTSEEGVLLLGVTVTPRLLELHAAFHDLVRPYADNPWAYYGVDAWMPHCTAALGLSEREQGEGMSLLRRAALPIPAGVHEIGIVDGSPTHCDTLFLRGLQ
jgi:hypothetical protein